MEAVTHAQIARGPLLRTTNLQQQQQQSRQGYSPRANEYLRIEKRMKEIYALPPGYGPEEEEEEEKQRDVPCARVATPT